MRARRRIFLYGNSVILGSIGASLQRSAQFEVTKLAPPLDEALKLNIGKPDVLIFDLETPQTEAVFSYLESNPSLLLVGISPDINLVQAWSGREFRELSTQGLFELIQSGAKDLPVGSNSNEDRP